MQRGRNNEYKTDSRLYWPVLNGACPQMTRILTPEQRHVVAQAIDRPYLAIWADMGAGKTAITLHAVSTLLKLGLIKRAVVVAPRAVADSTWRQECSLWPETSWMRVVTLRGTPADRRAQVSAPAEVYCIGRDALAVKGARRGCIASPDLLAIASMPEQTLLIVDEASSIKNSQSARFRALAWFPWGRVLELTGTPTPQGVQDVWPQMYLLDRGRALGKTITAFRTQYMRRKACGFGFEEVPGARETALHAVRHLILRLEAPPPCDVTYTDVYAQMNPVDLQAYQAFKRNMVAELEGKEITAVSAGALVGKLAAWASGGVYYPGAVRETLRPHFAKRRELERIFLTEPGPHLVFYWFNFSIEDIQAAAYTARKKFALFDAKRPEIVKAWNDGKIDVLAAHPQSAGMGLNLQYGGHKIVWLTCPWSSELWLQAVARLARRGQTETVQVTRIIAPGTIDERISHVLGGKIDTQKLILDELKIK